MDLSDNSRQRTHYDENRGIWPKDESRALVGQEQVIAHELAHRLHIRLVHGAEEKMGPIWFFEGLATYAACQFDEDTTSLSRKEVEEILAETGRGDYRKYNRAVKFFLSLVPLAELVRRAAGRNFQEWLLKNAAPQSAQ